MIGWIFMAGMILAMVSFLWIRHRLWKDFEETVRPADDLRRADDGYEFPTDDFTGGWL